MPIYEYADPETGIRLEVRRPVDDRNKPIVLVRAKDIPDRVLVFGTQPSEEETFDNGIIKALHRKEEKEGSRFRCGNWSKNQLKKIWTDPVRT